MFCSSHLVFHQSRGGNAKVLKAAQELLALLQKESPIPEKNEAETKAPKVEEKEDDEDGFSDWDAELGIEEVERTTLSTFISGNVIACFLVPFSHFSFRVAESNRG